MQENELLHEFEQGRLLILVSGRDEFNALMGYLEDNSDVRWASGRKPTGRNFTYESPNVYITRPLYDEDAPLRMYRTAQDLKYPRISIFASKFMNQFDCQQNDPFIPLDMSQLFEE